MQHFGMKVVTSKYLPEGVIGIMVSDDLFKFDIATPEPDLPIPQTQYIQAFKERLFEPVFSQKIGIVTNKLGKWGRLKLWKTRRPGRRFRWGEYPYSDSALAIKGNNHE